METLPRTFLGPKELVLVIAVTEDYKLSKNYIKFLVFIFFFQIIFKGENHMTQLSEGTYVFEDKNEDLPRSQIWQNIYKQDNYFNFKLHCISLKLC